MIFPFFLILSSFSSTNEPSESLRISQREIIFRRTYYFCLLFDQIKRKTARIRIKSLVIVGHYTISHLLRTTSIFHSSTVLPLSNFPLLPHPWFGHPLKNLYRITFGSRISFARSNERITRVYLCIQSTFHFVGPSIFFFSFFLPRFSRRTRDRALTWREGMPVVTIVKNPTG